MRVLHLSPTYFAPESVIGGGERFPTELARAMAELTPTRLVSFGKEEREFELSAQLQLRIYRDRRGGRDLASPLSLAFLRELKDCDLVHCHQYHSLPTNLATLHSRWRGKPVFCTDLGGGGWNLAFYLDFSRWLAGWLAISEHSARMLAGRRGAQRVVYAGVDTERYQPAGAKVQRVLYVGRLLPHKGVNYLVEAVPPDVELVVAGQPYHPEYFALLRRLAADKRVEFLTAASDEEVRRLYAESQVFVLPSVVRTIYGDEAKATELFGLVVVEAMAAGCAVVASNVASLPELVAEGKDGFLVPPNNPAALREKIVALLSDPGRSAEMGRAGREKVQRKFTWRATAERCLAAYQELGLSQPFVRLLRPLTFTYP